MPHEVRFKRHCYADMDELFAFVKTRSGTASAVAWRDGLLSRIASLKDHALVWPLSEEPGFAESGIRELLYRRSRFVYRIFYRIAGDEVFVHRIRSASQDNLQPDDL